MLKRHHAEGTTLSWGKVADSPPDELEIASGALSSNTPMYDQWSKPREAPREKEKKSEEMISDKNWKELVWTDLSNFYFSDDPPFATVKVYVELPHVHEIPSDDIRFSVAERNCLLLIRDMNSVNHRLRLDPTWGYIVPSECDIKVKKNKIIIRLVKKEVGHEGPWQKLQVS